MAGKETCHHCVYSRWDQGLWMRTLWSGFPARPECANHPDAPGRWQECPLRGVCRNYRRRPPTPTGETVMPIPVGDGLYAYVDAADFEWLNQWTWHLQGGYAVRKENGRLIFMHRAIMKPPKGMIVDHKNRNKLDNTRESLRVCTHRENAHNSAKRRDTSSRYKGVSYSKKHHKWCANLYWEGKYICLGYFDHEIEAARAYDRKAAECFGEFANLNFPLEWPPERVREVYAARPAGEDRSGGAKRVRRSRRRTRENRNHGQDARATKRPAGKSGNRGGKRVPRDRRGAGGKRSHGRDARATKRRKPAPRAKRNGGSGQTGRSRRETGAGPKRGKGSRAARPPKTGRQERPL